MSEREIRVWHAADHPLDQFDFGAKAEVGVWQGLGTDSTTSMGAGTATYKGQFEWVLNYDAVYYFLEGTLALTKRGITHHGSVGDIMFIPKGSAVTYESEQGCRIFWAILPGNWEAISDFSIARIGDSVHG